MLANNYFSININYKYNCYCHYYHHHFGRQLVTWIPMIPHLGIYALYNPLLLSIGCT